MLKKAHLKHLLFATVLTLPSLAMGAMSGSTCTLTLGWNSSYPLRFGSFAAGSGGTVTIGTSADSVTLTGGVFHFGGTINRARFNLTCPGSGMDSGANYIVTTDSSVTLSAGANTMTLNNFTTSPASGSIAVNGSATLYVGGRLNANANQAAGNYSGSFNVIVNYN